MESQPRPSLALGVKTLVACVLNVPEVRVNGFHLEDDVAECLEHRDAERVLKVEFTGGDRQQAVDRSLRSVGSLRRTLRNSCIE